MIPFIDSEDANERASFGRWRRGDEWRCLKRSLSHWKYAAFGYLLGGFLSAYSNTRTDTYGGDLENRTRIVRETIEKVRSAVGDMPIGCRICAEEFVEGGLTLAETKKIDSTTACRRGHRYYQCCSRSLSKHEPPYGAHKRDGRRSTCSARSEYKKVVDVPVICAGNILNLQLADAIIAEGKADLVAMGRAQVADPYLVTKTRNGLLDSIVECDWCNECMYWTG